MRRDHGGNVADTQLQLGLVVSVSKPWATGLPGLGLKPRKDLGVASGITGKIDIKLSVT